MSDWDNQYNSHPVWSVLDRIDALLEEVEGGLSESGAETVEAHARIRSVGRYARSLLDRSNPELVVLGRLTNLQNPLQAVATELDAFKSSGNIQHLTNAAKNCDNVLGQLNGLPAIVLREDVGVIREDLTSFRKSAAGYLRGVDEETRNLREALQHTREAADELAEEIQDQKGRVDQAITQTQEQTRETLSQQQTQFADAQEKRANQFQVELRKAVSELDQAVEKFGEDVEEFVERSTHDAEALVTQLHGQLEEARRIVNVVGNVGMTGDYQRNAEEQKKAAKRWQFAAIGFFVLAASVAALLLGFYAPADLGVAPTIRRTVIAVVLAAPAYYAAQQSRDHQALERRYRAMELELASMNPYLALLPDELQQAVKTELASRYFGGLDGEAPPLSVDERLDTIRRLRPTRDQVVSNSDD